MVGISWAYILWANHALEASKREKVNLLSVTCLILLLNNPKEDSIGETSYHTSCKWSDDPGQWISWMGWYSLCIEVLHNEQDHCRQNLLPASTHSITTSKCQNPTESDQCAHCFITVVKWHSKPWMPPTVNILSSFDWIPYFASSSSEQEN
jgi:hypothetical protein